MMESVHYFTEIEKNKAEDKIPIERETERERQNPEKMKKQ